MEQCTINWWYKRSKMGWFIINTTLEVTQFFGEHQTTIPVDGVIANHSWDLLEDSSLWGIWPTRLGSWQMVRQIVGSLPKKKKLICFHKSKDFPIIRFNCFFLETIFCWGTPETLKRPIFWWTSPHHLPKRASNVIVNSSAAENHLLRCFNPVPNETIIIGKIQKFMLNASICFMVKLVKSQNHDCSSENSSHFNDSFLI